MRIPSFRNIGAALDAVDPFRLASRLADRVRRYFRRIDADQRRRRAKGALRLVRADLARWHATISIPAGERLWLARRFSRTLYPLYYVSIVMDRRLEAANLRVGLIGCVVYFVVLPYYALPAGSRLDYVQAIFLSMLGAGLLYGVVNTLVWVTAKFFEADAEPIKRLQLRGWAALGLLAGMLLWVEISGSSAPSSGNQVLLLVAAGVFGIAAIIFISTSVYVGVLMAVRAWSQRHHPDAYVVRRLFNALRELETSGGRWAELTLRTEIAAEIGGAGVLVRQSLFRDFPGRDAATVQWRARQVERIAAAFAEKQRWLMTPKADTREALISWLARSVVALLSGAWDGLELLIDDEPSSEAGDRVPKRRWSAALMPRLRTLMVGILPVLLFIGARRLDLIHEMSPELLGYAELTLLGWGILVLMFILDPEGIKDKIATMREAVSVLRPDRKKD